MDSKQIARLNELMGGMSTSSGDHKSFRGCLYGPSGAGKTDLAILTMDTAINDPNMGILHIDTSENWVVKDNIVARGVKLKHGYVHMPFTFIEDLRLISEAIANKVGAFAFVGGIILDEATSMSEDDLDRLYEGRVAAMDAGTISIPKEGRPGAPDWADYRPALVRFRSMLTDLFKIPGLHVILVAHESRDAKTSYIAPSFSPQIRKKVKEPLHLVARLTADIKTAPGTTEAKFERKVQVHPTLAADAKTRIPVSEVSFAAEYLPGAVRQWLDMGAPEVEAVDTAVVDNTEQNKEIANLTTEEALAHVEASIDAHVEASIDDVTTDDFDNPFDKIN